MNLDRIQIAPRLRNAWEAIDLGFVMARTWWRPLMISWLVPALLIFIVLSLILPNHNYLAFMITWWLKPLYDRAPLYIASQRLFGETIGVADTFRVLHKIYFTDIFPWLTWRRFSVTRSFDMPITVLENLKGSKRSQRLFVLHQRTSNAAVWLTIVCANIEMSIVFGVMGLAALLIPEQSDVHIMSYFMGDSNMAAFIINVCSFVAMSLVAPFYTMAGFSLYINRRISLEAWDIEIRFRHMAHKFKKKSLSSVAILILGLGLVLQCIPRQVVADVQSSFSPKQAGTLVNKVLAGEEFHHQVFKEGWRLKNSKDEQQHDGSIPEWLLSIIRYLESFKSDKSEPANISLPNILEGLLWIGVLLIVVIVIRLLYRYKDVFKLRAIHRADINSEALPDVLFGLDVRKHSLPDDIDGQVLNLCRQGKQREAIGLLYRAMLSQLMHGYGFRFNQSSTELECVAMVQASYHDSIKTYVRQVTGEWQKIAYAHVLSSEESIQQLCHTWKIMERNES